MPEGKPWRDPEVDRILVPRRFIHLSVDTIAFGAVSRNICWLYGVNLNYPKVTITSV